jgi:hypothetical protein
MTAHFLLCWPRSSRASGHDGVQLLLHLTPEPAAAVDAIGRVLWLGYEDNETEPHFCALMPRSDSMPFVKHVVVAVQTGASMLVSDSAVVLAP